MQRVRKTLLTRAEEQCIQHVGGASFGMESTSKHHLLELRSHRHIHTQKNIQLYMEINTIDLPAS